MKLNSIYEILTPDGWRDFKGVRKLDPRHTIRLTFANGVAISATPDHVFFSNGAKVEAGDLRVGVVVDAAGGPIAVVAVEAESEPMHVFDVFEVGHPGHKFLLSDCIHTKNCDEFAFVAPNKSKEFWTSIQPVLSTGGSCIITSTPKSDVDQFSQIWKGAEPIDDYGNPRPDGLGENGFFRLMVPWWEHPDRDEEWAAPYRKSLGEARFRQEFECVSGGTTITLRNVYGEVADVAIGSAFEAWRDQRHVPNGKELAVNPGCEVLTPSGWQDFAGVALMGLNRTIEMTFDRATVGVSVGHGFITPDGETVRADALVVGDRIRGEHGVLTVLQITPGSEAKPTYSLIEVAGGRQYFTNGVASKNCEFVTDDETLINPLRLSYMKAKPVEFYTGTVRWYKEPEANKAYMVALDPSMGTGGDHAAIQVFEMPGMIQVAEWQHNMSVPRAQVRTLMQILLFLEDCLRNDPDQHGDPELFWTVENNSLGEAILQIIEDTGEERFPGMLVSERKRKGQTRRFRKGMNTNNKNKLSACARFKTLVESDRMEIRSEQLLKELKVFVAKEASFGAKPGEHDDLVSACLLVCRMLDVVAHWGSDVGNLRETIGDDELFDGDNGEPLPVVV